MRKIGMECDRMRIIEPLIYLCPTLNAMKKPVAGMFGFEYSIAADF